MQFLKVNGVTLHHQVISAAAGKPKLVFVNSLGTDFRIWRDVVVRLAGDFAILTYDARGHGLSEIGDTPYSIETLGADLAALIDATGFGPAIVCGVSVGGLTAQALYADAARSRRGADPLRHRPQDRHRRGLERAHRQSSSRTASRQSPTPCSRAGSPKTSRNTESRLRRLPHHADPHAASRAISRPSPRSAMPTSPRSRRRSPCRRSASAARSISRRRRS